MPPRTDPSTEGTHAATASKSTVSRFLFADLLYPPHSAAQLRAAGSSTEMWVPGSAPFLAAICWRRVTRILAHLYANGAVLAAVLWPPQQVMGAT